MGDSVQRTVYPIVRYADPRAAIDWLVKAFDFTEQSAAEGPDGKIVHAELIVGTGMVMVSAGKPVPDQGIYIAVDNVDDHHDRAKAAGAEIVMGLTDQEYGSREYAARDPEGNSWYFGTYRP